MTLGVVVLFVLFTFSLCTLVLGLCGAMIARRPALSGAFVLLIICLIRLMAWVGRMEH